MAESGDGQKLTGLLNAAEVELRRYEARLGVWKVVLGTFIVGLAGILIPGALNYYNSYFENLRKDIELRQSQQTAHQQYIKEFIDTAINQDIELRIRFADYFASLSDEEHKKLWTVYHGNLLKQRDTTQVEIHDLERSVIFLEAQSKARQQTADWASAYFETRRSLRWAYVEIGYQPTERAPIDPALAETADDKRPRLYRETLEIVEKISRLTESVNMDSTSLDRFWALHDRELIGVESHDFARTMVAIGKILKQLALDNLAPTPGLTSLAVELRAVAEREFGARDRNAAQ